MEEKKLTRITSVAASEQVKAQSLNLLQQCIRIVIYRISQKAWFSDKLMELSSIEGDTPVFAEGLAVCGVSKSRVVWDCSPKWEINFF